MDSQNAGRGRIGLAADRWYHSQGLCGKLASKHGCGIDGHWLGLTVEELQDATWRDLLDSKSSEAQLAWDHFREASEGGNLKPHLVPFRFLESLSAMTRSKLF